MNRRKKTALNVITSFGLQFITIISGLIIPRLLLSFFGSEVNGMVSAITEFLGYIVLLEGGVGGVVKAALYKPIAQNDYYKVSGILSATERFFRIIAAIFIVYVFVLASVFPMIVKSSFSWIYTASLIVIIAISTVAQYLFGFTYQMLLAADQKLYVTNLLNIITVLLNTVLSVILLFSGFGIHIVKLGSTAVFVLRPLFTFYYVKKKYKLEKKATLDNNAIKQRWDGFGQHIAFFIHTNTDIVVLSLFSTITNISVYTVHMFPINGVKNIINSISQGFAPAIGDMIARDEREKLAKTVDAFEFITFFLVIIAFTVTALMIEPFVGLYTKGITDANYYQPLFSYIMCIAEAFYVIRCVYSAVIMSAGHFKQTNKGAFVEAVVNIVTSVLLIKHLGLLGVALGTCLAMVIRTFDYVFYLSKHILHRNPLIFFKRIVVNGLIVISSCFFMILNFDNSCETWIRWIGNSIITVCVVSVFSVVWNLAFYKNEVFILIKRFVKNKN